jgi:hypothetical protein
MANIVPTIVHAYASTSRSMVARNILSAGASGPDISPIPG